MVECRAAVEYLRERDDLPGDVRRALETAAPVAYARPWGKTNTIGGLAEHWLPESPSGRTLHRELVKLRDKLYAHTDEEFGARCVADVSKMLGTPGPFYAPAWRPLNLDSLPEISALAEAQKIRFVDGAAELMEQLRP
jgi:hypothetical protein